MAAIEKFVRIFAITVPAFFAREKPISRNAKPACMNITRTPATITHIELIPTESGMPFLPTASIRSADAALGRASAARAATATAGATLRARFVISVAPLRDIPTTRPRYGRPVQGSLDRCRKWRERFSPACRVTAHCPVSARLATTGTLCGPLLGSAPAAAPDREARPAGSERGTQDA